MQPLTEMAGVATRMVLDLAARGSRPNTLRVELATTLVERSNTAAPSATS